MMAECGLITHLFGVAGFDFFPITAFFNESATSGGM